MHHFQNIRRLLGALPRDPYQRFVYGPSWGTKAPGPLICPPLEKNPSGAMLAVGPGRAHYVTTNHGYAKLLTTADLCLPGCRYT